MSKVSRHSSSCRRARMLSLRRHRLDTSRPGARSRALSSIGIGTSIDRFDDDDIDASAADSDIHPLTLSRDTPHGRLSEVRRKNGSRLYRRSQSGRIAQREQLGRRSAGKNILERHQRAGRQANSDRNFSLLRLRLSRIIRQRGVRRRLTMALSPCHAANRIPRVIAISAATGFTVNRDHYSLTPIQRILFHGQRNRSPLAN